MVIIAWRDEVSQFKANARQDLDISQQASEVERSRDGSNRQELLLASVWSMTAVVFKSRSSDETRPTSLMDSLIFSVQSRSCTNGQWSCRTDASKADLIKVKEESWHQQPSIAHVASHYFGLNNLLLEGVADRDWGITSTMAMVALTGKSCFRIFYFTNYKLSYLLLLCHSLASSRSNENAE